MCLLKKCCVGQGAQPMRLLELLHLKISVVPSIPLSKHWPQLAAKAGQEFIFISWNSVDLKSLLNVNFQKSHASAFWATTGRKKRTDYREHKLSQILAFLSLLVCMTWRTTCRQLTSSNYYGLLLIWSQKKLCWQGSNPIPSLAFFSECFHLSEYGGCHRKNPAVGSQLLECWLIDRVLKRCLSLWNCYQKWHKMSLLTQFVNCICIYNEQRDLVK